MEDSLTLTSSSVFGSFVVENGRLVEGKADAMVRISAYDVALSYF